MAKKHTEMKLTFRVVFKDSMTDHDITQFMKNINLDLDESKVENVELVKLSK